MTHFILYKEGLKKEHAAQIPLLEKIYTPPEFGKKQVSRVYDDGSLYLLSLPRKDIQNEDQVPWHFLSKLNSQGISELKELLKDCCENETGAGSKVQPLGFVIWRFFCNEISIERKEPMIPGKRNSVYEKLDFILKHKLQQIPKEN